MSIKYFEYVDDIYFIIDGFVDFFYIVFDILELYVMFFGLKINSIKNKSYLYWLKKEIC